MQKAHKYSCIVISDNPNIDGTEVLIAPGTKKHHYKFSWVEPVREDAPQEEINWHERVLQSHVVRGV